MMVDTALTSLVGSTSLAAIGLSLNSSNELEIDSTTLESALSNNLSAVQKLFSYEATTSSSDLTFSSRGTCTYSGTITLAVTTDTSGNITGVSGTDSSGNAIKFTYSGSTISGAYGSSCYGLTFTYSGSSSETITIQASQGIADQLYQDSNNLGNSSTGSVETVISNLQTEDTNYQSQVSALQEQANTYATYLLNQYGTLEAKISEANQTYSLLQEMMSDTSS
jgi:flagellar hook-associated protein 2